MDAVTEGWPLRPMTVEEVRAITTSGDFEYSRPMFALQTNPCEAVIVVYIENGRCGDYYGFDPVTEEWEHVTVADISDEIVVHARTLAILHVWLLETYPGGFTVLDHDGVPLV